MRIQIKKRGHKMANTTEKLTILQLKMEEYNIQSKGKSLSGHFPPEEAVDLLETAANRGQSISEVITRAVALGLPMVKKQFPPITDDYRSRPGQIHSVHIITPRLAKLMRKWKILKKGKTLTGHFIPEQAVDVLETAHTRRMSTGSVLKAAVRIGLPNVKKQFPRPLNIASIIGK
jgi:hypothetical protein